MPMKRNSRKFKGDFTQLIPAFVLLSTILPLNNGNCNKTNDETTAEWIYRHCMQNETNANPSVVCYVPRESLISCQGIVNHDNCTKAFATCSVSPSPKLSVMKKDNFAFDETNQQLCFRPEIEPWGSVYSFFGYELWVEFFESTNPDAKTVERLGAIFRSGVGNRTVLEATFGCVKTPAHIPYRSTSFFISFGNSLPMQTSSNRTGQEEEYSLDSLKKVSLDDGTYLKDYVNTSTPMFQFKEMPCDPNPSNNSVPCEPHPSNNSVPCEPHPSNNSVPCEPHPSNNSEPKMSDDALAALVFGGVLAVVVLGLAIAIPLTKRYCPELPYGDPLPFAPRKENPNNDATPDRMEMVQRSIPNHQDASNNFEGTNNESKV